MRQLLFVGISLMSQMGYAQPYISGGNTRHRFAQLNAGIELNYFSGNGTSTYFLNGNNEMEKKPMLNTGQLRAVIGGTHFWGHADFYVSFGVAQTNYEGFRAGVETGAKLFPWRIENGKLRPYVGVAWLSTHYQQGEGAQVSRSRFPVLAGFYYNRGSSLFALNAGLLPKNSFEYYISKEQVANVQGPQYWVGISYKYMIDATLSAEHDWNSGRTRILTDTLAKLKRLNGITLAVGPSTAAYLHASPNNTGTLAYLGQHKFSNVFMDFGLGYYLHRPDVHFNIAYRQNHSTQEAYGTTQTMRRKALTFEGYKFLWDYHGFVPFIGPSLGYEWLSANQTSTTGENYEGSFRGIKPGLTFGWDIRPNSIQSWYLRTSLRWIPNLKVTMSNGGVMDFTQLEFNFIQLVIFPGRML